MVVSDSVDAQEENVLVLLVWIVQKDSVLVLVWIVQRHSAEYKRLSHVKK